jgi:hexosaminidase
MPFNEARLMLYFAGLLLVGACAQSGYAQADTEPLRHPPAATIAIEWEVLTNFVDDGGRFRSQLTLTNRGEVALPASGWTLYFNFLRPIDPASTPPAIAIERVNGDFFRMTPQSGFAPIRPGERRAIEFASPASAIKTVDAPSGYYFVFDDAQGQPGPPAVVPDASVASFTRPWQTDRGPTDAVPVPTAESRFRQHQALRTLPDSAVSRVTPTPHVLVMHRKIRARSTPFSLRADDVIAYEAGLAHEAQFLADALAPLLGARPRTEEGAASEAPITLRRDLVTVGQRRERADGGVEYLTVAPDSEAYEMSVDAAGIEIVGVDAAGVFYGIQSLRMLLPLEAYQEEQASIDVPAVTMSDAPRFPYRGLHLDVSRNFQTKDAVKRLLDVMALYKLNTFHFHLTDDEGWRLAIDGLPELTEIGGRRGHTTNEREHLVPSYGSGPDPAPSASHGSGWYTRADFIEILQYAHERHIEVIPEVDVPGHARAAIVAMKERHRRLMAEGRPEAANRYRLHDPDDRSAYRSVQGWDDNVINVCQPSTYRFLETVVDDIRAMYDEAEVPLTTVHVGGDEVPSGAWAQSPTCQQFIAASDRVEGVDELFDYFLERMSTMLSERGLTTGGWEEVALTERHQDGSTTAVPKPTLVDDNVRPYVWANIWGSGTEDHAYQLANAGYEVVMSHASNLYLDMAYNKHPQEGGFYWANFIDNAGPFDFVPLDLYKSAHEDQMGHPIDSEAAFADATRLTETGRRNILGLQGQLWGETLQGADRMEYMAVPRLISLAERAWARQPDWATVEDAVERDRQRQRAWAEFANRLGQQELPRLTGIDPAWTYRLPVPGAVIEDGQLRANTALPGLTVRYTTDGSAPTAQSTPYAGPVSVRGAEVVKLRTFDAQGRGSRVATLRAK